MLSVAELARATIAIATMIALMRLLEWAFYDRNRPKR
jgi:hypothetical protein